MSFFGLPLEIRDIIWRKARFLHRKDMLVRNLANRPVPKRIDRRSCWVVSLQVNGTKTMHLEKHMYPDEISWITDISEYHDPAFIYVTHDEHVRVVILPDHSTRLRRQVDGYILECRLENDYLRFLYRLHTN